MTEVSRRGNPPALKETVHFGICPIESPIERPLCTLSIWWEATAEQRWRWMAQAMGPDSETTCEECLRIMRAPNRHGFFHE